MFVESVEKSIGHFRSSDAYSMNHLKGHKPLLFHIQVSNQVHTDVHTHVHTKYILCGFNLTKQLWYIKSKMDGIESSNICLYDVEVKNEQINVTLVGKIMIF